MSKTALAAIMAVRPGIETIKVKGRGKASLDKFIEAAKADYQKNSIIDEYEEYTEEKEK